MLAKIGVWLRATARINARFKILEIDRANGFVKVEVVYPLSFIVGIPLKELAGSEGRSPSPPHLKVGGADLLNDGGSPSLDSYVPKREKIDDQGCYLYRRRRRKRAWQRISSGVEIAKLKGWRLRFLTLTSSPEASTSNLGRDFSKLAKRIRYKFGQFEYVRVRTAEGYGVLHVLYRGKFIPQRWLSSNWAEIRKASKIAWINEIKQSPTDFCRVSNYVITQYVAGQKGETHLSWSFGWVYRSFCQDWRAYKREFKSSAVDVWRIHIRAVASSLEDFDWRLGKPPPTLGIEYLLPAFEKQLPMATDPAYWGR